VRDAEFGRRLADKLARAVDTNGQKDWMLCLPEELEERLGSEIRIYETVEHMPYVTSVERIGIRKGIRQGLQRERLLLLRQTLTQAAP
jgi:hypothetical protein